MTTPVDQTMLQAALNMAAKGFRIFPLVELSKSQPMVSDWPDFATTDTTTITRVWNKYPKANIGILCDDLIVIDVDVRNGKPGMASLMDLDLDLNTFTVKTPSGGLHVYYSGPNVKNSVGRIGPGLDIRSRHGFVVAAGSSTRDGPYRIVCERPVRVAESSLIERCTAASLIVIEGGASTPAATLDVEANVERAARFLAVDASPAIQGERGDETALLAIMTIKDMGVSQPMALDLIMEHYAPRCASSFPLDEQSEWFKTKIANAYRYGALPPGIDAPEHQFKSVAVEAPESIPVLADGWYHHNDPYSFDYAWMFYNLLPAVGVAVVTGPTNSGKSFLLMEQARCLGAGKSFFGVEPDERGGSIFLYAGTEGSGVEGRLKALGEEADLPIAIQRITRPLNTPGALAELQTQIEAKADQMLARYGCPVRMVVFETLSASGLLKDENDNSEAAAAMAILGAMSLRMKALFVTSHHPDKTGKGSRGASSIPNSADYVIEINREGMQNVREVKLVKARTAPQRVLGSYTLVDVVLGKDRRGRKVTSCVVSIGGVQTENMKKATHADLLMTCIEHALVDEQNEDPDAIMPEESEVRKLFTDRCPVRDRGNRSRAYHSALDWVIAMGAAEIVLKNHRKYLTTKEPIT
jgi:hypothetical protein